jgi:hypothetical protein
MFEQEFENVAPTTEETEVQVEQIEDIADESAKVYTEEDFQRMREEYDRKLDKKVSRREAKIRKEYERKYGDLENVLRAGSGKETVEELTETFTDFYTKNGVDIPQKPQYNARDIEVLARHEADEIIQGGLEDVIEEVDRLAQIGVANMDARERAMFQRLAEYRQSAERSNELEKIGVGKDVYESQDFKDFAKKFNANVPITDVYNIYNSQKPKKEIQTMGSITTNRAKEQKEFYTEEEISRLTEDDLDDPQVWEAVRRSMTGGR